MQVPVSVVDDNQKVVGALSVVGAMKMSKCSQNLPQCHFKILQGFCTISRFPATIWNFPEFRQIP